MSKTERKRPGREKKVKCFYCKNGKEMLPESLIIHTKKFHEGLPVKRKMDQKFGIVEMFGIETGKVRK